MTAQFLRITCYGQHAKSGAKKHETASQIISEAYRDRGSVPHLRHPKAPNQLFGSDQQTAIRRLTDFLNNARSERGAPLRRDANVLYAIVVSYPLPWRKMVSDKDRSTYASWRDSAVAWLKARFGNALLAVLEHIDENRPHLHAFCLPGLNALNRIEHNDHPGYQARSEALAKGADHKGGERAYRHGLRQFQDDFQQTVSSHFGHARIGPRRKRLRRDAVLSQQRASNALERISDLAAHMRSYLVSLPTLADAEAMEGLERLEELLESVEKELLPGQVTQARQVALADAPHGITALDKTRGLRSEPPEEQFWGIEDDIGPDEANTIQGREDEPPGTDHAEHDDNHAFDSEDKEDDPSFDDDDPGFAREGDFDMGGDD